MAFPRVDPGLPAKPIEDLLRANEDLLARIKLCYGADQETFERDVLPLIRRYAQYVHLLPATPDNYFAEVGGLLRLGLEVGFYALQGTDGHIFSGRATISARKHLEPRWRHATFIAGLCSEIHLAVGRVEVTDLGSAQWTPYLMALSHWLAEQHADRYFVKWLPGEGHTRALGLFALQHVVSPETLQYLSSGNTVIVPHLLASIAGLPMHRMPGGEHNVLDDLVRRAFALVVDRNLRSSADRLGRTQLGVHVERYLVDAMRRLVAGGASWTPNTERSRLWFGADGLYLVWPQAAADICKLLESDQIPGIPKAPETLAELLAASGAVTPRTALDIAWSIAPPPGKMIMEALKISVPAMLFAGLAREPQALPQRLAVLAAATPGHDSSAIDPARQPSHEACGDPASAMRSTASDTPAVTLAGQDDGQAPYEGEGADDERQLSLLDEAQAPRPGSQPNGPAAEATGMLTGVPVARPERAGLTSSDPPHPPDPRGQTDSHPARSVANATPQPSLGISLDAPMRLDSAVRTALAAAIATLNGDPQGESSVVGACTVPTGIFVPLREFERRGVEPPTAVRLLSELSMLAGPGANGGTSIGAQRTAHNKTVVHDFGGTEAIGVIVSPRFVKGLDLARFRREPAQRGEPC